jgi:FixJ family two-component response regulator
VERAHQVSPRHGKKNRHRRRQSGRRQDTTGCLDAPRSGDLNLPLVSGFEVLEFLKSDPHLKRLPVVVLSGSSNQQEIERCYAAGANSYICKPTGINQVFSMASDLVSYWFEQTKLPKRFVATHT